MRPKILFVDDEQDVLEDLKRTLHGWRERWDMDFVVGGERALAAMEAAAADVLVTDMRMPGMDGAELLSCVRRRWPSTLRLVLSGRADGDLLLRATSVAHQFLKKPLRQEALLDVVDRIVRVRSLSDNPAVRHLAGKLGDLPSGPGTYGDLILAIQDAGQSNADIARVVERDPFVSTRALRMVNSSYFGFGRQVVSVREAVVLLGPPTLIGMALMAPVMERRSKEAGIPELIEAVQERALSCCLWVRRLDPEGRLKEEALTTALIHDLGTVLLAIAEPEAYRLVADRLRLLPLEGHRLEESVFGASHSELGAHLFGLWGLPFLIVEAVAGHHRSDLSAVGDRSIVAAIHGADVLSYSERSGTDPMTLADLNLLREAGMDERFVALARELNPVKAAPDGG